MISSIATALSLKIFKYKAKNMKIFKFFNLMLNFKIYYLLIISKYSHK